MSCRLKSCSTSLAVIPNDPRSLQSNQAAALDAAAMLLILWAMLTVCLAIPAPAPSVLPYLISTHPASLSPPHPWPPAAPSPTNHLLTVLLHSLPLSSLPSPYHPKIGPPLLLLTVLLRLVHPIIGERSLLPVPPFLPSPFLPPLTIPTTPALDIPLCPAPNAAAHTELLLNPHLSYNSPPSLLTVLLHPVSPAIWLADCFPHPTPFFPPSPNNFKIAPTPPPFAYGAAASGESSHSPFPRFPPVLISTLLIPAPAYSVVASGESSHLNSCSRDVPSGPSFLLAAAPLSIAKKHPKPHRTPIPPCLIPPSPTAPCPPPPCL